MIIIIITMVINIFLILGFRVCCPGQRQPAEDLEVKRQGHRVSLGFRVSGLGFRV